MGIVVGDTLYFSADGGGGGIEMWAYDTSNLSTWQVSDIQTGIGSSEPGRYASLLLGDTIYFDANDGNSGVELWAYDTSNQSTWQVADINNGGDCSNVGHYIAIIV